MLMSAYGTKQTGPSRLAMSAFEGKADIPQRVFMSAYDDVDGARSAASECQRVVA
jgi:hypothetical protein